MLYLLIFGKLSIFMILSLILHLNAHCLCVIKSVHHNLKNRVLERCTLGSNVWLTIIVVFTPPVFLA